MPIQYAILKPERGRLDRPLTWFAAVIAERMRVHKTLTGGRAAPIE